MIDTEAQRQLTQRRLDEARTATDRNRLGQFATPPGLALDIARYALELWQGRTTAATFLDPAIGTGSFYSALRQVFPPEAIADACGVEIDPAFADAARRLWAGAGLRVIPGDFTTLSPDRAYHLILTNPPYVRHHHLERADKERLKALVADRFHLDISGLAGLYAHFLLLCDAWMAPGGLAVWLIPSEFMDVNYGAAVKTYLTDHIKLLHIHRYCPSDVQFCDALVTSAIVVFEKAAPPPDHQVRLSFGGPITGPTASETVTLAALRQSRKWTRLARGPAPDAEASHTLGDFFSIKRGIATGANAFFILERQEAIRKGIPTEFLRPILPSSRHLPNAVIEAEPDGYPAAGKAAGHHRLRPAGAGHSDAAPGVLEIHRARQGAGHPFRLSGQPPDALVLPGETRPGSLPVHLYGAREEQRQSVSFLLEPIAGDRGERLPAALSQG